MSRPAPATVALVTCAAYPALSSDDRVLQSVLAARGFRVLVREWDAASHWEDADAIVVRSCWDYHHRPDQFAQWLDRLERSGARLFNPGRAIRWNMRKTYLGDLAAAGIPIVPTVWVKLGDGTSLGAVAQSAGWSEMVVKPTVSASAFETWRGRP